MQLGSGPSEAFAYKGLPRRELADWRLEGQYEPRSAPL
jgi:hypothetical protein